MPLDQSAFRGRNDNVALASSDFTHPPVTPWVQPPGAEFRVRFAVSGDGTVGGQLEFSTGGTAYVNVTDTSGTVQAARSSHFAEGNSTTALLTDSDGFVSGSADEEDGAVESVVLSGEHTELEYCVRLIPDDVSSGGTVSLRIAGLDSYTQEPAISVGLSGLDRVRLLIGDTNVADELLTDAEINSKLANWPSNVDLAAADAAEAIAAKFSRGFNFSSDGQAFNRSERVEHYQALADKLRRRSGTYAWPPIS